MLKDSWKAKYQFTNVHVGDIETAEPIFCFRHSGLCNVYFCYWMCVPAWNQHNIFIGNVLRICICICLVAQRGLVMFTRTITCGKYIIDTNELLLLHYHAPFWLVQAEESFFTP